MPDTPQSSRSTIARWPARLQVKSLPIARQRSRAPANRRTVHISTPQQSSATYPYRPGPCQNGNAFDWFGWDLRSTGALTEQHNLASLS
jgi:hypothetical protein